MKIDQNGVPSVVTANTAEDGLAIASAVVVPAIPATSFGTLVNDLLDTTPDKAEIIIDPVGRKVWSRSAGLALISQLQTVSDYTVTLTPDAGQTGKSLTFTSGDTAGVDSAIVAAITAAIGAAKPKRSVQSLVSSILSADFGEHVPVIGVDQVNGVVKVYQLEGADASLAGIGSDDSDQAVIALAASGTSSADPLIFEGGETV